MITTQSVKEDELRVPTHAQFELNGLDSLEQKKQQVTFFGMKRTLNGYLNTWRSMSS